MIKIADTSYNTCYTIQLTLFDQIGVHQLRIAQFRYMKSPEE